MNTEFHPKRLLTTLGFLTLFLVAGLIATVPAESTVHEEDNIPIATIIELSFDSIGIADSVFADSSTLESTVNALELIQLLELKYTESMRRMYNKLADHILSLQDSGGGFRDRNIGQGSTWRLLYLHARADGPIRLDIWATFCGTSLDCLPSTEGILKNLKKLEYINRK